MRKRRRQQVLHASARPQLTGGVDVVPAAAHASVVQFKRFYEPDSVRVMTDALDFACRMLPDDARESESLRRRLALRIMHDLDTGERDPARLAAVAVLSLRI